MILKKTKFKKKQLIIRFFFKKYELYNTVKKSLFKNHNYNYKIRLSFTFTKLNQLNSYKFKSYQKLICFYSLGKKVPSKHFFFSRFYLNRQLNFLKINNTAS